MRVFACLVVFALSAPPAAGAQAVRRCVTAGGQSVFTDLPCESLGATPRTGDGGAPAGATLAPGFAIRGCARTLRQLLEGVRGALGARDVNRLANYYHWPGTGPGAARYLMDELERIAARPTVGLGYPDEERPVPAAPGHGNGDSPGPGAPASPTTGPPAPVPSPMSDPFTPVPAATPLAAAAADPTSGPPGAPLADAAPVRAPPARLRVEQAPGASAADASLPVTEFLVVRHADCWWITL